MKELRGRVLHLQAPDCRTTSVRWGSMGGTGIAKEEEKALGVELPLLRMQVKDLGQMCYVDVAVRTREGETVVLRASNWQVRPFSFFSSFLFHRFAFSGWVDYLSPS